jgi:hypothetical protein
VLIGVKRLPKFRKSNFRLTDFSFLLPFDNIDNASLRELGVMGSEQVNWLILMNDQKRGRFQP